MTIGIYKITSPSGRVYIGQSTNIEKRFSDYKTLTGCKKQTRLFSSFKSHGARNHIFEIVEVCEEKQLNTLERKWQDAFDVISDNGLNCRLTVSTDKSGRHSVRSIALMREKQSGANNPNFGKRGIQTSCYGRKRTEAERAAIKAFQATRGQIIQQLEVTTGVVLREARARDYAAEGYSQGNISLCRTGRAKTHKGFAFRYKETA